MDGIIIVNKPKNCTSHDIVYKVKKAFKEKVGHTGTLDPMATGVLPILIGKGTLVSKYLINHDKIYEVELELGRKTDTADSEGKILQEQEVDKTILEKENIEKTLNTFLGKQKQKPPMYSAIKVNGKKLYEYARKGQTIDVQERDIEIYSIKLINIKKEENIVSFEVKCSKGTYIRSLCEDIANRLNNIGYMRNLNRTKVGDFSIENAIDISKVEVIQEKEEYKEKKEDFLNNNFIPLEKLFEDKEEILLNEKAVSLILNGVKITRNLTDGIYRLYKLEENVKTFVGIGVVKDNLLKRDIIV